MDGGRNVFSGINGQEIDAATGATLAGLMETRTRAMSQIGGGAMPGTISGAPLPAMVGAGMMMNPMMMGGFQPMMMNPAMAMGGELVREEISLSRC